MFAGELLGLQVRCTTDAIEPGIVCIATGELPDLNGRNQWHCHVTNPRLGDAESATVHAWLAGCLTAPRRVVRRPV